MVPTPTVVSFGNALEEELLSPDAFKRTEQFTLNEIVELDTVPMPPEMLKARHIDTETPEFKATFPNGVPCLLIGLKGIDVDYAYSADHIRRIYVPIYNTSGPNYGQRKGRLSQLDIVVQAFEQVLRAKPFGAANKAKLIGLKARWGEHIGTADIDKQRVEWGWDVPRTLLPRDFVYTGEVRVRQARAGSSAAASAGMVELDDEQAINILVATVVGKPLTAVEELCEEALTIAGLPSNWVNAALDKSLLRQLNEQGKIDARNGVIVAV